MSNYIYNEENFEMNIHGRSFMQVVQGIFEDNKFSTVNYIFHESLHGYIVSIFKTKEQIENGERITTHCTAPRVSPENMELILRTGLLRYIDAGTTGTLYTEEYPTFNLAFKKHV